MADPTADPTAYTRRLSLLDPGYRREALREIRRIVPTVRGRPFVNLYDGQRRAGHRPAPRAGPANGLRPPAGAPTSARRRGFALPDPAARPTSSPREELRWLAWSRFSGARFFRMKEEQARLIRRLDPAAVVSPNDYGFIDGFIPWDYTRLSRFADVVEADPYVSFPERDRAGRGRYNPGFGAKLLSDLTGKRTRIVVQAFDYSRYRPTPGDLWTWTAQALRAGATDISFFASDNPRFTNRRLYDAMLAIARSDARRAAAGAAVRPRAARALRHGERGAGPAGPARGRALPHVRRRALHHLRAAGGAGRGSLQLRRRHAPRGRARAAGPRRARCGCRAATPSTPAFAQAVAAWVRAGRDADRHRPGRLRAHARRGRPSRRCATS